MEDFFETFNEQSLVLCRKIDALCEPSGKVELIADKLSSLCTLDIICGNQCIFSVVLSSHFFFKLEAAMGCKVNAQLEETDYAKAVARFNRVKRPFIISL
jgi:hypothetical protein